jgi:hypothetical protein
VTVTEVRPATGNWVATLYRHRSWLWLVPAVPGAVLALLVTAVLPADSTLDNLGEWAFKLSPFVLAVFAVALLPRGRFGPVPVVLAVIVYMGYLDTAMVTRILKFGRAPTDAAFAPIYQFELFTATFVVLFGLLAYRMGGARTASVLKLGVAAILVVISGLNDLTFWATYDWPNGRPDVFAWASHMIVFTGGPPVPLTATVFVVVHLALAGAVLTVPLGRWVDSRVAPHLGVG